MRRFAVAILGLMLLAAPAAASDGMQAAARATKAAQAFQQHAQQIAATGKRLDFTAGPASEHFRRVFDVKAFAELPPAAASDMQWITDWMGAVSIANHALYEFGADMTRTKQLDLAVLARNVQDYEDQMTAAMIFQQKLSPRVVETGYEFLASLPETERTEVRLKGLAKMVTGYLETIRGSICFAGDTTINPTNARMIAAAVHASIDVWSEYVEDDMRKEFVGVLIAAQQQTKDKDTAAHFRAIQGALEAAKS